MQGPQRLGLDIRNDNLIRQAVASAPSLKKNPRNTAAAEKGK